MTYRVLAAAAQFKARKKPIVVTVFGPLTKEFRIKTREGELVACVGDYVIRGIEGELYPIGAEIFEKTYERVETNNRSSEVVA